MKHPFEIDSIDDLQSQLPDLSNQTIQHIDFSAHPIEWDSCTIKNTNFLGCTFRSTAERDHLRERGALIFPGFGDLPFHPYRASLYSIEELLDGYSETNDQSADKKIFDHFSTHRGSGVPIMECLAQRIHDHAIDDALEELLATGHKRPIGIMGGHGTSRTDPWYRKVVEICRSLTRSGYFIVTGGGPGIMEAGNLGAWLAPHPDEALDEALDQLAAAPRYTDPGFISISQDVARRFPDGGESLAVPTWFYGHEPSNVFSPHIAKYFSNSLREDGLLAIAIYGVIYAPGSAGTLQEVFMDLCQNHYTTFRYQSPMVFLGKKHYGNTTGLLPMLEKFTAERPYADMIAAFDEPDEIVDFIKKHPPRDSQA